MERLLSRKGPVMRKKSNMAKAMNSSLIITNCLRLGGTSFRTTKKKGALPKGSMTRQRRAAADRMDISDNCNLKIELLEI